MAKAPRSRSVRNEDSGRLRLANPGDAAALIALEAASFSTDRLAPRQWRYLLRRPSVEIWIEEGGGEAPEHGCPPLRAALVLLFRRGTRLARIYSLATAREWRGHGLAGRLLTLAEHRARLRGCDRLALEVRKDNEVALALYRRHGFEIGRKLPGYYADGGDGLRLEKTIGGS